LLVSIRDCRSKQDREWIRGVYSEYIDALADLNTGLYPVISATEHPSGEEIFSHWFSNDHSHPLLILKGSDPVGFALVSRPRMRSAGKDAVEYHMSEFFVRAPHRLAGIGRDAARLIFDRFAGEWEVIEYQRNAGAVAFWRRVLNAYCRGRFTERIQDGEVRQRFSSRRASGGPGATPRA